MFSRSPQAPAPAALIANAPPAAGAPLALYPNIRMVGAHSCLDNPSAWFSVAVLSYSRHAPS